MNSGESDKVFQALGSDDPTTVGNYRLTARLGAGGMGKVYLSYTPGGRPVALKVIRPEFAEDPEFRRRFRQEVQAAQQVHGLYTAPVIDSDAEGSSPWLATAFVSGPTLTAAVAEHGPLPAPTVLLLVAGIAEALQAVHAAGLIHRDLKPSNVLLAADGPRVIDFGIARAADATALTDSGITVGTPAFMSPEQAAGREVTTATDVFALGQVAVYAALGAPAYGEGSSHAVLYRIVHEEPELSSLSAELSPLVSRCLAKDPAQRPSLAEILAMCQEASDQTQLRRPDQWLPGSLAAAIPERHVAPTHAPTSADPSATPVAPATQPPTAAVAPPPTAGVTQLDAPPPPPAPLHPNPAYQATQAAPPVGYAPTPAPFPGPHHPMGPGPMGPGTHGSVPRYQPPLPPPRKKNRGLIIAAIVVAFVVVSAVGSLLNALKGDDKDDPAQNSGHSSDETGTRGDSENGTEGDVSGTDSRPSQEPEPKATPFTDIQLADGYHLIFGDETLQPHQEGDGDLNYTCDHLLDNGCYFNSYEAEFVLLDPGQEGSLDTCLKDTRFTNRIDRPRLSSGSQFCVRTTTGTMALVTYGGGSAADDASEYVQLDVTVWRNVIDPV